MQMSSLFHLCVFNFIVFISFPNIPKPANQKIFPNHQQMFLWKFFLSPKMFLYPSNHQGNWINCTFVHASLIYARRLNANNLPSALSSHSVIIYESLFMIFVTKKKVYYRNHC